MNEIRVLIGFDDKSNTYEKHLNDPRFKIDTRSVTSIGNTTDADTLTEYDAIIINYKKGLGIYGDRLWQFYNFLNKENKLFVFILNRHYEANNQSSSQLIGSIVQNIGIDPAQFIFPGPSGSKFELSSQANGCIFGSYLNSKEKTWSISFGNFNDPFVIPLAKNTDGHLVAFSLEHDRIKSSNYFLPWLPENEAIFWNTIQDFLLNKNKNSKDVAAWVKTYHFSQMAAVTKNIEEKQAEITKLELEKEELEKQKENYERIRNTLLYHDGDLLHSVCKEVLNFLGLNAEDGKQGREDLVFIQDNNHYLVEIKGCEKSASKNHVKQVISHIAEYKNENEVDVKGILLINAWRKLPLEERNTPDKPIFPSEIMTLVKLSNITLITTQQLFIAYCEKLSGIFNLENFIKLLNNTVGILLGYDDFNKYKIN